MSKSVSVPSVALNCNRRSLADIPIELLQHCILPCLTDAVDRNSLLSCCRSWQTLLRQTRCISLNAMCTERFLNDANYRNTVLSLIHVPRMMKYRNLTLTINKRVFDVNILLSVSAHIHQIVIVNLNNASRKSFQALKALPRLSPLVSVKEYTVNIKIHPVLQIHVIQSLNINEFYQLSSPYFVGGRLAGHLVNGIEEATWFDWRALRGFERIHFRQESALLHLSPGKALEEVIFEDDVGSNLLSMFAQVPKVTLNRCINADLWLFAESKEVSLSHMAVRDVSMLQNATKVVLEEILIDDISSLGKVSELQVKKSIAIGIFPQATGQQQRWSFSQVALTGTQLEGFRRVHQLTLSECYNVRDLSPLNGVHTLTWHASYLPRGIEALVSLRDLKLSSVSDLESLRLDALSNLAKLEISGFNNPLGPELLVLPASIAQLRSLRTLVVDGNFHQQQLSLMTHVENVHLQNCTMEYEMSVLKHVQELQLSNCPHVYSIADMHNVSGKGVPGHWMNPTSKWFFLIWP